MSIRRTRTELISYAQSLALVEGRGRFAVRILKKIPKSKRSTECWLMLGRIQNFCGHRRVAEYSARQALAKSPLCIYARADLIVLLCLRRRYAKAWDYAVEAVQVFKHILKSRGFSRLLVQNDEISDLGKAIFELAMARPAYRKKCRELLDQVSRLDAKGSLSRHYYLKLKSHPKN
jgi:hypothetical protein